MAQTITNVLNANIETLRSGPLPRLFELSDFASAKVLKGAEKHQITKTTNSADFRIPLLIQPPGQFGAANLAGGSLGLGDGMVIKQFLQTYFPTKLGFQLNYDSVKGTQNKEQSVINVFRDTTKMALPVYQRYDDVSWHSIGGSQGIIGVAASAPSATQYIMNADYGANLLLIGQRVEIFDSTLVTQKTSAVTPDDLPIVAAVDKVNKTVTLSNLGAITIAAGDRLLFQGCGATPAWANGLQYFNDNSTSGNLLGLSRSTYPEIIANGVNVSGTVTPANAMLLKNRIRQRRTVFKKMVGLMPLAQEAQFIQNVVNIQNLYRDSPTQKMIDTVPDAADMVPFCGVWHIPDLHQSNSRIDWVDPTTWGRVYLNNAGPDFYTDPGSGEKFFSQRSSNGGVATATLFYFITEQNYYCADPGANGYMYNLTIPTGY